MGEASATTRRYFSVAAPAMSDMPPTPDKIRDIYQKTLLLPCGGAWYDSLEEANAHPGRGHTVCVRETSHSFFGAYPTEQEYFDTAGAYLELRAERTAEEIERLQTKAPEEHELTPESIGGLALPPAGRWFLSEAAAVAALALVEGGTGFVDSVRVEVDPDFLVWCLYPSEGAFLEDILGTWPDAAVDHHT
jgi:hypothetical protein